MPGLQLEGAALVRPTDAAAAYAHLHILKEPTAECSSERYANAGVIWSSPTDNTQKDPDEWVSGNDPMTGAQASYLKPYVSRPVRLNCSSTI